MLKQLSELEKETLIKLSETGPNGEYNMVALGKLFILNLITVDDARQVVLTHEGQTALRKIKGNGNGGKRRGT